MVYYRVYQEENGRTPKGYGSKGARWNLKGTDMIYCSNQKSLALFEILSIFGTKVSSKDYCVVTLEITGSISYLEPKLLPPDWNTLPRSESTQKIGTAWTQSMDSLGLMVPSARIPLTTYREEHNLLINPNHPEFNQHFNVTSTEIHNFLLGT